MFLSSIFNDEESSHASCADCGENYESFGIDVVFPNSQWKLICPENDELLCAKCIANRVSKIEGAIVIHGVIEFINFKK